MYKTELPKESTSVRKDESMDSASTPYARYESNNSARGKGMNSTFSVKYFRRIADLTAHNNEQLSGLYPSVYIIAFKSSMVRKDSRSKSGNALSKTDNLDKTTTDKQPIQIVYDCFIAPSKPNDRQPIETVRNRLIELLQEEEECDVSKPTEHSFTTAWRLVHEASELRGKYFQKATVATDDEGGIRLRWRNPNKDREVRLYCPANTTKKMYIYHEEGDSYRAEYNVSGTTLAEWLYWLSDA